MAKHRKHAAEDEAAEAAGADATPAGDAAPEGAVTSQGAVPEPTAGPAEAARDGQPPKGETTYPPPASDSSGERTGNIPPTKLVPPDPPAGQGPEADPTPQAPKAAAAKPGSLLVSVPGSTLPALAVEVDPGLSEADQHRQAVNIYRSRLGVWALPGEPSVGPAGD
jgi:hypothetical protein